MRPAAPAGRDLPLVWTYLVVVAAACVLLGAGAVRAGEEKAMPEAFKLEDFLGRKWRNECVSFPLSEAQLAHAKAGHALVGPDEKPVAYQIVPWWEGLLMIEFHVDLDPFETRTYRFTDKAEAVATDLRVEETPEFIRLVNGRTGITIPKALKDGGGPIGAVRVNSGKWVGGSRIESKQEVTSYEVCDIERGPAFAEASCLVHFGKGSNWTISFRLQANEPVVLVDEYFEVPAEPLFVVSLGREFSPSHILYRYGKGMPGDANAVGSLHTWQIGPDAEPPFVWVPWLPWWERLRENTWFALYREDGPDLLSIGALWPGNWVDPKRENGVPHIPVTLENGELTMKLPLKAGHRFWMLCALGKDETLGVLNDKNVYQAPLPQQYLIKYGDFPLNTVKDYVLEWPEDVQNHPRLLVTQADVAAYRKRYKPDPAALQNCLAQPVTQYALENWISCYFGTGDAALGKKLADTAVAWVQASVDMYLHQDALVTLGFAPHHQTQVITAASLTDAVLASDQFPPDLRRRVLAQLAFLGYTVNRPDYWSPERGYCANPNMTSTVAAYQAVIAGTIPDHPMAKEWMGRAMKELKDIELDTWSDDNGGWLEAPHYAMVSYDYMLGCFLMAHNAGLNDYLYDPKMKKIAGWFGKISTPRDARLTDRRHKPPIGNTYIGEPTGEFAAVAYLWKDKDPEFAANMQWMWQEHGKFAWPGIGGFYPTLAGYRTILLDPGIPAKAPAWKSELFPKTGVILRNKFPCDRETQLLMIAGDNHAHYDRDSGSITMWGKGRIVADDFGYTGYGLGEDHSMVESPLAPADEIMHITEFSPSDELDYVAGVKNGWKRQIAFVKDPDSLAPNYFVICDSLEKPAAAIWRLWFTAAKVTAEGQRALAEGKEDVDTDVLFLLPEKVELKTADKSCNSHGMRADGGQMMMSTTQTGVIADVKQTAGFTVVLYPRLKAEKPAVLTRIADGRGVKVESAAGTDYVFVGPERFTFQEGDVSFDGTVGAAQMRGKRLSLSLGAWGRIAARGETLDSQTAASRVKQVE